MPKATHTARHDDAGILSAVERCSHRNALLLLDGHHGAAKAARAHQIVQLLRRAVRARRITRASEHGIDLAVLNAAVRGYHTALADGSFPAVASVAEQWQLLVGIHATFERHTDDYTQFLTGVVLGFEWDPAGPCLRVALTHPTFTAETGDVITIAACHWHTSPTPAHIAATASRDTHCPAGRPLYTAAELPYAVLATKSDLALSRRRPKLLQPPVASLRHTSGVVELYARIDTEDIPTLPRNQLAITRRRTCAQCGFTTPVPLPQAHDGKRYCPDHLEAATQRAISAAAARNRAVSVVWARETLADPATILVVMLGAPDDFRVRVEDTSGKLLLHETIAESPLPSAYRHRHHDIPPTELPDWVHSQHARALGNKRAVLTSSRRATLYYESMVENELQREIENPTDHPSELVRVDGNHVRWQRSFFTINERPGDDLALRRQIWQGDDLMGRLYNSYSRYTDVDPSHDEEALLDPVAMIAAMRHDLQQMAGTPLTEQQSKHAAGLLHNRRAPEYKGHYRLRGAKFSRISDAITLFGKDE